MELVPLNPFDEIWEKLSLFENNLQQCIFCAVLVEISELRVQTCQHSKI